MIKSANFPKINSRAFCESSKVGTGTEIKAFVYIASGCKIGEHCLIQEGAVIGEGVQIGSQSTVGSGCNLSGNLKIGKGVLLEPNVVFSKSDTGMETIIHDDVVIRANASIDAGVDVGRNVIIKAGAIVSESIPDYAIVSGNPARIIGYTNTLLAGAQRNPVDGDMDQIPSKVRGVTIQKLKYAKDMRGELVVTEFNRDVPFKVKRSFLVYGVPSSETRGMHAHYSCHQFLVCVKGSCRVIVDDGECREEIILNSITKGLYLPPLTWGVQDQYSNDAILLVFTSDYYDNNDYIRDYNEFRRIVDAQQLESFTK